MERVINGRMKQLQKQIQIAKENGAEYGEINELYEGVQKLKAEAKKSDQTEDNTVYSISDLARQIRKDWKKPNYGAVPYIEAMMSINRVTDMYHEESAKSIVNYFLANAGTWRGEEAKRIKSILKKTVS